MKFLLIGFISVFVCTVCNGAEPQSAQPIRPHLGETNDHETNEVKKLAMMGFGNIYSVGVSNDGVFKVERDGKTGLSVGKTEEGKLLMKLVGGHLGTKNVNINGQFS
eukprot:GHVR01091914.1.p1 GENE.GHVR01091914.1~~GHVR01091914.1.p1  ORF type:complete len:107 (+),score=5.61 GHVR01091914.1:197-517(+)